MRNNPIIIILGSLTLLKNKLINLFDVQNASNKRKFKFYETRNEYSISIHNKTTTPESVKNQIQNTVSVEDNSKKELEKNEIYITQLHNVTEGNPKAVAPHFWVHRRVSIDEALKFLERINQGNLLFI